MMLVIVTIFVSLCVAETVTAAESGDEKTPLYFSFIITKTGSFVASGAIPVVDLALEQINNRSDILPDYTLNYITILDSKVR